MSIESYIQQAREVGASDIHLEPGLPMALRCRGALKTQGEPVSAATLKEMARGLLTDAHWSSFVERRSFDLAKTIAGVRCRINILHSVRGIGFAIRLLSNFRPTIQNLNLHPQLGAMMRSHDHGLIIVSGATGSGKTSTLAAMIQEINANESRHIVTLESPIEYMITPSKSYIRQREVGRDTPSFEQGLYDALREDPDVLMVGEMRDPETMRLTLNAAETGHLVLATLHSSTAADALSRIVSAFPAEIQPSIAAQLADCLVGVVCQRLTYREDIHMRVPECEILMASMAAKSTIRAAQFTKIQSVLETGGKEGTYSFHRYREWLNSCSDFYKPGPKDEQSMAADIEPAHDMIKTRPKSKEEKRDDGVIEIDGDETDLTSLVQQLEKRGRDKK